MQNLYPKIEYEWKKIISYLLCKYYGFARSLQRFKFKDQSYAYFIHEYNKTWENERTIEIPIIRKIVDRNKGLNILEIGNVLSHYFQSDHDVVDKYEKNKNVINADAAYFKLGKKYDLIISISTLEHIGWDEEKKEVGKIFKALDNLKRHLKKNGKIIFTHPLGYNSIFDNYIKEGKIPCKEKFLLKRITKDNRWVEVEWKQIFEDIKYNRPFPYANGIVIGVL